MNKTKSKFSVLMELHSSEGNRQGKSLKDKEVKYSYSPESPGIGSRTHHRYQNLGCSSPIVGPSTAMVPHPGNQPPLIVWYCRMYLVKKSAYPWTHTVQTRVLEQHRLELCRSTYRWIFFNKYAVSPRFPWVPHLQIRSAHYGT